MYSGKLVDVEREVSVNVKDQKIDQVLNSLFANTDVVYSVNDRIIVLSTPDLIKKGLLKRLTTTICYRESYRL